MLQKRERDITVDILRGIAAICMILGHSFLEYPVNISTVPWCAAVQRVIYTFHMELFFILAGWVYHCRDYKAFLIGKAKRLLVPYGVFGTLTLLVKSFGGAAINGREPLSDGIIKFLLMGGNYWFLYTLFLMCAVYPLLERVFNTLRKKLILLAAALLIRQFVPLPLLFALSNLVGYLPYFILGDLARRFLHSDVREKLHTFWAVGAVAALGIYAAIDALMASGYALGATLGFSEGRLFARHCSAL